MTYGCSNSSLTVEPSFEAPYNEHILTKTTSLLCRNALPLSQGNTKFRSSVPMVVRTFQGGGEGKRGLKRGIYGCTKQRHGHSLCVAALTAAWLLAPPLNLLTMNKRS